MSCKCSHVKKKGDIEDKIITNAALVAAFQSINAKKGSKRNNLFCIKPNAVLDSQQVMSKEFVTSCPLAKSNSVPDLRLKEQDITGHLTDKDKQSRNDSNSDINSSSNEKKEELPYRPRKRAQSERSRRRGVCERCEEDRVVFRHALKSYSVIRSAMSYSLI